MEKPVAIELEQNQKPYLLSYEQAPASSKASSLPKDEKQGLFSYLHFLPMFSLTRKANRLTKQNKSLAHTDLPNLSKSERPDAMEEKIAHYLQNSKTGKPVKGKSVTWAVFKAVKWTLLAWIVVHTAFFFLRIFTAWVFKKLIESYLDESQSISEAYQWSGILCAIMVLCFYSEHHYNYLSYLLPTHIRSSLISLIYSKVTRLSAYSLNQISLGKLVNLVVADMSVFELTANFSTNAITSIFGLAGSTALLWIFFGPCCLVGVGFIILSVPLQQLFIFLTGKEKLNKGDATDQRIKLTSEIIEGIRLLKMYAWELRFRDMVEVIRKKELHHMTKILIWESVERGLTFGAHSIALFLMLVTYVYTDHELDLTTVFPAFYLLGILRLYGSIYATFALNFFFDAKIVMNRVQEVMDFPESEDVKIEEPRDTRNAVEFENFSGYWTSDKTEGKAEGDKLINSESKPTLADITMNIKKGSLNALIGTVGASKTSFLLSFTGEMPKTTGSFRKRGTIAYAEQEPTIFAGTFRENVLFGKPFNQDFYDKVVKACNLENDLKLFANGDMSEIGEKGNNLSGGQRARLGLARAVYADADIYLLDDPLSAVDAKVAKSLVNDTILTMLKDKTVILVTHQVHFVKDFENIIVIDGGHVLGKGSYEELKAMNIDVDRIFYSNGDKDEKKKSSVKPEDIQAPQNGEKVETQQIEVKEKQEAQKPKQNAEQESYFTSEDPYAGRVDLKAYKGFMDEMGGIPIILLLVVIFILTEFTNVGFMRILGGWAIDEFNLKIGISVTGSLAVLVNLIYVFRSVFMAMLFLRVSRRLQAKVLNAVVRAPVRFFDTNPIGRILSRFSNDVGILDTYLPLLTMNTLDIFSDLFCLIFALSIINPILIAPLAGIVIGSVLMMLFSYQSVKQTKDCELDTRDPVNNLFSASLSGMTIIKVYSQESTFKQKFRDLLTNNTKASVAFCNTSSFFGFYADMMFTLGGIACVFIITAREMAPPLAALCIVSIINITGMLSFGLRQLIQVNVLMASVSRMQAYTKISKEAPTILSKDEEYKKQGWPQKGDIDFHKVYMKYRPDTDYVIRDLNLHAYPGEKIGCIGRTGAGKSTIIQLLFRLVELDRNGADKADSHIKLDDVNIQELGLHLLRNNISIIPQVPFIFSGTVKKNIDPIGKFSDDEIWRVLEDVNLKAHVEKLDGQINFEIGGTSPAFSVGQKQLICLARTILNPSNLLVLDEATANMDQQTDNFIQAKIMEKFASSTVFTIAHRLSTIANYDKVLVLDKGRKVEFEAPYRLLVKEIGDDHITNKDGHFGSMVMNTGPKASKHIFEIAKATYFKKFGKDGQIKGDYKKL